MGCPMAFLINAVDRKSPSNKGPVCTISLMNPAGPSETDSATIGRINENNVAAAQMAAFAAISFVFADGVIVYFHERVIAEGGHRTSKITRSRREISIVKTPGFATRVHWNARDGRVLVGCRWRIASQSPEQFQNS